MHTPPSDGGCGATATAKTPPPTVPPGGIRVMPDLNPPPPVATSGVTRDTPGPYRFKTRLCDHHAADGNCEYGSRCMFAHGPHELRTVEQNMREAAMRDDHAAGSRSQRQQQRRAAEAPRASAPARASDSDLAATTTTTEGVAMLHHAPSPSLQYHHHHHHQQLHAQAHLQPAPQLQQHHIHHLYQHATGPQPPSIILVAAPAHAQTQPPAHLPQPPFHHNQVPPPHGVAGQLPVPHHLLAVPAPPPGAQPLPYHSVPMHGAPAAHGPTAPAYTGAPQFTTVLAAPTTGDGWAQYAETRKS